MAGTTIRVMIADDHLMVRKGLRLMLEEEGEGVELVGDAASGKEAVTLVELLQPDVVLMDIRMPEMDGIAALKQIRASWPDVAVILLTTYNEDDLMLQGLQAGACGYLLKDTPVKTLLYALQTAARGVCSWSWTRFNTCPGCRQPTASCSGDKAPPGDPGS